MITGLHRLWPVLLLAAAVCFARPVPHAIASPALQPPAAGTIRALVVGIDQYPNLSAQDQLSGAAADAQDIANALGRVGVDDLTLLLDTAATRAAFTAAMENLAAKAAAGDLIIVTFAGHGSQEKERVPGSEPDGMDEEFILSPIGSKGPNTLERIIDDEIFNWLKRLSAKGAEIIFVADSCHGGGMTKAPTRGGTRRGVRGLSRAYSESEAGPGTFLIAPGDDELSIPTDIPPSDNATFDIPSLTFLAGVDDQSEVVERTIDGSRRGALSYAFARALDGANLKGEITREALFKAIHQHVLQLTEHEQSPVMEPRTLETARRVLFRKLGAAPAQAVQSDIPEVKIVKLEGTATAPAPQGLHAFWDQSTGDVISETRTVLAYGVAQSALPAVAKRVSATAALTRMAAQAPLQADIVPHKKEFASGERFRLIVEGLYGRYLLIVNLAGSGEVQYLFPTGNADPMMMENRLEIPMRAAPPYGADTLIILASKKRPRDLELDLSLIDKHAKPDELLRAVKGQMESADLLGVVSYGTRP